MAEELVFYTNPQSRGQIARWMLEEVGAPYRVEPVRYGDEMKSPPYRRINPMGKVPAIRHGDQVVTETAAICAYLADAFPEAGLAPPADQRGAYYRWLFFGAGPLEAAVANKTIGFEPSAEHEMTLGFGNLGTVMDVLEAELTAREYIAGDRFTAADVYIGAHITWGVNMMHTLEKRPAFIDYAERMNARPAQQRASALDEELASKLEV
ncbi:MAG: glutathione S-transferase family protein [Gammaproteobacteria bacterium]|nr:glutathione S-transferase family protein [Gammaproteobacteria bacterium]